MVECSLCSLLSFSFRCVTNVLSTALDYPIVIFLLSLLLAVLLMSNVHAAKLICDFGNMATRGFGLDVPTNLLQVTSTFDYGAERGPHTWSCSEINQSPINIIDDYIRKFPIRELLTWNHYDDLPVAVMMENNGHTVIVRAAFEGNAPTLSGADLLASYKFMEICFRWSLLNTEGSEHMLNYRKFPLELQAMHHAGTAGDSISSYDLLIVAYVFEISTHNPYLDPIIQNLHRIQRPGSKIEISPFPLAYLCHQFRTGFYSYGGSLTEPPCYQGAEWFVFPEPLAISERQLNEFRQILCYDGKTRIIRNARPVQSIDESRVVNLNQYAPLDVSNISEQAENGVSFEEE